MRNRRVICQLMTDTETIYWNFHRQFYGINGFMFGPEWEKSTEKKLRDMERRYPGILQSCSEKARDYAVFRIKEIVLNTENSA